MRPTSRELSRRSILGAAAASVVSSRSWSLSDERTAGIVLNDASRLNPTTVTRHTILADRNRNRLIADLRSRLKEAAVDGRPVVLGGARHSMGGQSLYPTSEAITHAAFACTPNLASKGYTVSAGARWRAIVPVLDAIGRSVPVMQSNNDFSVGGTLSVNGHGWAVPHGAFASTVREFRMMLADGTVVSCSRSENVDLFRGAVGGYGLLGIVIDVDLDMVENVALRPTVERRHVEDVATAFSNVVGHDPDLRMAYGRVSVAPGSFLKEALLVTFRQTADPVSTLTNNRDGAFAFLSRELLRHQTGSSFGKTMRWWAESTLSSRLAPPVIMRNRLLNLPVASLGDPGAGRTDILHEYFLPPDQLAAFLMACRMSIASSGQDLLNVTLRYVAADPVSLLAFAPQPRIAAVLLFSQSMTSEAESSMRRLTERMVDSVLAHGGSFYLPYRLHARRDQVARAYPGLETFEHLKRRHDPQGRFRNMLFDAYLT